MAATPRPWELDDESVIEHQGAIIANVMMVDDFPCLDRDDEAFIAEVEKECQDNARLIVRAVNCHDDLVTMLRGAVHALRSYQFNNASPELAEAVADRCELFLARA